MKDRAIGPAHDTHYRITMPGGQTMYEPFCSCGWEGARTLTQSEADEIAGGHVKAERLAAAANARSATCPPKSTPPTTACPPISSSTAGWPSAPAAGRPRVLTQRGALRSGESHTDFNLGVQGGSPPTPTDERKSGDSVWERHKIGDCADPCIYCMDERAERRTRPAAEIREQYDKARADITESIYHADVVLALGWVLGLEDYKPPMES